MFPTSGPPSPRPLALPGGAYPPPPPPPAAPPYGAPYQAPLPPAPGGWQADPGPYAAPGPHAAPGPYAAPPQGPTPAAPVQAYRGGPELVYAVLVAICSAAWSKVKGIFGGGRAAEAPPRP